MPQSKYDKYLTTPPAEPTLAPSKYEKYLAAPPTATGAEQEPPPQSLAARALGLGGSVLETVGNVLGVPQQMLFGAIDASQKGRSIGAGDLTKQAVAPLTQGTKPITGEQLLTQGGWEGDSWGKWGAGLATDIVADPLNLVGVGAVKSAVKASLPVRAAGALADKVLMTPEVARAMRPVANVGSRDYQKYKYLATAQKRASENRAIHRVADAFAPVAGSAADLDRTQRALNTGDVPTDIAPVVQNLRQHFDDLFTRGADAGIVDPATHRKDYFPRVAEVAGKSVNLTDVDQSPFTVVTNPHAKPRVLDEATNTVKDPIIAAATHALRQEALIGNVDFIRGAAEKFGAISDVPVEGMRKLRVQAGALPFGKELSKMHFPEVIAGDIEHLLDHRYELGDIGKMSRAINGYYKTVTTTLNPGFHMTNAVGNVAQMVTLGRMNPALVGKRMAEAVKLSKGTLPDTMTFGKYTASEARALADKFGVSGIEFGQFSNLDTDITDLLRQKGVDTAWRQRPHSAIGQAVDTAKSGARAVVDKASALGGLVENHSRMALFLDGLARGLSPEDATLRVRKALFDYSEVPDAVRFTRDTMAPYMTWLYKNLPAQMKLVATDPERAALAPKVRRALEGDQPLTDEEKPAYARERGMVDTGSRTEKGAHLLLDPNFPAQDLEIFQGLANSEPEMTLRNLGGQLAPVPATLLELAMGQDIRSGRPLWPEKRYITNPMTGEKLPTSRTKAPEALAALDALLGTSLTTPMRTSSGDVQRTVSPVTGLLARRAIPNVVNQAGRAAVGLTELGDDGNEHAGFAGTGDAWNGIPLPLLLALQRWGTGMTMTAITPEQAKRNQAYLRKDAQALLNQARSVKARTLQTPPATSPD